MAVDVIASSLSASAATRQPDGSSRDRLDNVSYLPDRALLRRTAATPPAAVPDTDPEGVA